MTAICGGHTSSPRGGFGSTISFTASAIAALLNNIPTAWAVPLAGYIGLVTYDLASYCASDPPAVPTITAADGLALLNPFEPIGFIAAQDKFQQLVGAYAWYQFCQCDSVSTPAAPAAPTTPTNFPAVDPTTPLTPNPTIATPCWIYYTSTRGFDGGQSFPTTDPYDVKSGQTGAFIRFSWHPDTGAVAVNFHYTITWQRADGSTISTTAAQLVVAGFTDYTLFWELPAGTQNFIITWGTPSNTSHGYFQLNVDAYCDGRIPGGTVSGCCPPDPTLIQLMQNVLGMVTLVQRQTAPFGYVAGASHSALSGNGHLLVEGLLGAKVVLDSAGSSVGFLSGDPAEVYSAGWITWGNADGSSKREFVTHSPFVSLPALAGQYTRLGYTLGDGVSATITELVREP